MRPRRVFAAVGIAITALVVLLASGVWWIYSSESGLRWAVAELLAGLGDRLTLEGVHGTLDSDVVIDVARYRGEGAMIVARHVIARWSPRALLSRGIRLRSLAVDSLDVETMQSGKPATPQGSFGLPASLGLPVSVAIDDAKIGRLTVLPVGGTRLSLAEIAFAYEGGRGGHTVSKMQVSSEWGRFAGEAHIGAAAPHELSARVAFEGNEAGKDIRVDAVVGGTLEAPHAQASVARRDARADVRADLAPFAPGKLVRMEGTFTDIDARAFVAAAPSTRIGGTFQVEPDGAAFRGAIEAKNTQSGPIDAERIPIRTLGADFRYADDALAIDRLDVVLDRGGRVRGRGRIGKAAASEWSVTIADISLDAIVSKLKPTKLSGRVEATLDKEVQRVRGEVHDSAIGGSFAASIKDARIEVERAKVALAGGTVEGHGAYEWTGDGRFTAALTATSLDPSAVGTYPKASISGRVTASGSVRPTPSATVAFELAPSSTLKSARLAGRGKANLTSTRLSAVDLALSLGSNALTLKGATGAKGDTLVYSIDARDLGMLAKIAPDIDVAGAARASGTVAGSWDAPVVAFSLTGNALRYGKDYTLARVSAKGRVAPLSRSGSDPLQAKIEADALRIGATSLDHSTIAIDGTVARHAGTLTVRSRTDSLDARISGALAFTGNIPRWRGSVAALESKGRYAVSLTEPAAIDVTRERIEVAHARARFEGGELVIAKLLYDHGRLDTAGSFSALPAAFALALAGVGDKLHSTLTLEGQWSLVASPDLRGSLSIRRRDGDLIPRNEPSLALGLSKLELDARSDNGRLDATLSAISRFGRADASATWVQTARLDARFDENAPLSLKAQIAMSTLRPLQAMLGTTAIVDGSIAAALEGRGTLKGVALTGTVDGDGLRIDAPQYGMSLTDGRIRARLAQGIVYLDELVLKTGEGSFAARGTLPASTVETSRGSITWNASKLRLFARPDARLVVSGAGTLDLARSGVALNGHLAADDGHFEYRPSRPDRLGSDVVVRGRERKDATSAADFKVPFAVDLDLDFARNVTLLAEGLDARLDGKIHVVTDGKTPIRAQGSIFAVYGTYTAFGQRLTIQRGRLLFDGLLDNPGLDILALRKNLAVEAGVAITGTVRTPIVQLTSDPSVPDNEKLSWLVLGHGTESANSAEFAALQVAMSTLSGGGPSLTQRIANTFGVDDISLRSADNATATGAASQVVAVSKRLTDRISIAYEQGLSLANNAVKIEYALTPTVTLRAQAGAVTGFGVYYNRSYD